MLCRWHGLSCVCGDVDEPVAEEGNRIPGGEYCEQEPDGSGAFPDRRAGHLSRQDTTSANPVATPTRNAARRLRLIPALASGSNEVNDKELHGNQYPIFRPAPPR